MADGAHREAPDPRLVIAVADDLIEQTAVVSAVMPMVAAGEVYRAVVAAEEHLNALSASTRRAWNRCIQAGASLCHALRACAIADDEKRALDELEHLEALEIFDTRGDLPPAIDQWRIVVADLLVAATLADSRDVDRGAACAALCAAETASRLLARAAGTSDVLPWEPAAVHGIVILPVAFAVSNDGEEDAEREDAAPLGDLSFGPMVPHGPRPASELLASGAIRSYTGDLIILDQQLRRYTLGEIAHVENVLLSETFERVHRDLKRVEVRVTEEQDTEILNERDLQSTDREELRSELSKAVREDLRVGAEISVTVSGKTPNGQYAVGVGGSFSYARSSEQREQRAQSHAREMVEHARRQITERTRTSRSTTTTSEDEDTTTHGFNNVGGKDHVVGVYRWIEKEYDLHLINYGRRLFYEIVIPEPAAWWKLVSARRSSVEAGPSPPRPAVHVGTQGQSETLAPAHLSLRDSSQVAVDYPERWDELVELAGTWGVELDSPPPAVRKLIFEIAVAPLTEDTASKEIHAFGTPPDFFYESGMPRTAKLEKAPVIPEGYLAEEGEVSFTGWMVQSKTVGGVPNGSPYNTRLQFERGYAWLQIGGRQERFSIGVDAGDGAVTRALNAVFASGISLPAGELPVVLTTTLNGAVCSVRMTCRRTPAAEIEWISDTLDRFAAAYAERLAQHAEVAKQSELDQRQMDFIRTDDAYRAIERRELKRQIIDLLMAGQLDDFGTKVVDEPYIDDDGHVKAPEIDGYQLPVFTRMVNFFEQAFDWANLVYVFAPYFFGKRGTWDVSALAEESDPQFTAFLSAGAARVQLPAQPGYEPYVHAFFSGLWPGDPTQSVPWLPTGRPIALDLAGAARDGFELWPGRISLKASSTRATIDGATFDAEADTGRELRIHGHVFKIESVISPTELELDRMVDKFEVQREQYERGGLIVGPTISLRLPSTLVAIDKAGLALPEFDGRYA
jgi:hypothetical protein